MFKQQNSCISPCFRFIFLLEPLKNWIESWLKMWISSELGFHQEEWESWWPNHITEKQIRFFNNKHKNSCISTKNGDRTHTTAWWFHIIMCTLRWSNMAMLLAIDKSMAGPIFTTQWLVLFTTQLTVEKNGWPQTCTESTHGWYIDALHTLLWMARAQAHQPQSSWRKIRVQFCKSQWPLHTLNPFCQEDSILEASWYCCVLPSGKLTKNYGKSLFYSWVNPL